jgi:hypothetical protein
VWGYCGTAQFDPSSCRFLKLVLITRAEWPDRPLVGVLRICGEE